MSIAFEDEPSSPFAAPLAFARARRGRRVGLLTDGFTTPRFARGLLSGLKARADITFGDGRILFRAVGGLPPDLAEDGEIERPRLEQTHSTLIVGRRVVIKLLRRKVVGEHPEAEMGRALTARGFDGIAPMLGEVVREDKDGQVSALAIVQGFVANQGDGASWTIEQLKRTIDELSVHPHQEGAHFEAYEDFATVLGRRVGQLHQVLEQPGPSPAFAPEHATASVLQDWHEALLAQLAEALAVVSEHGAVAPRLAAVSQLRPRLAEVVRTILEAAEGLVLTRIHGDLHLGQVLVSAGDVVLIDFEGEPNKSLEQRRAKTSPLRDVAGELRSFDYAAAIAARESRIASGGLGEARAAALLDEFRQVAQTRFLRGYEEGRGRRLSACETRVLLVFALEKAAYEISYEAANRPDWIEIPLAGLESLLARLLSGDGNGH